MNNNPASAVYQLCDLGKSPEPVSQSAKEGLLIVLYGSNGRVHVKVLRPWELVLRRLSHFETFLQVPEKPTIYFVTQVISFPRLIISSLK